MFMVFWGEPFFLFSDIGIHYTAKIICEPSNGIPQLPLVEWRIKSTETCWNAADSWLLRCWDRQND